MHNAMRRPRWLLGLLLVIGATIVVVLSVPAAVSTSTAQDCNGNIIVGTNGPDSIHGHGRR